MVAHGHQSVRDVNRARQRHVELEQNLQIARALDPGGVLQFLGDGPERLAQQKNAECRGDVGQRDRRDRIEDAEEAHRAVVLDD